jgi:hypothetical protein
MRNELARAGKSGWRHLWSLTLGRSARRRLAAGPKPGLEALESRELLAVFHPTYTLFHGAGGNAPQSTSGPTGTSPTAIRHAYGFDQISFANGTIPGDGSGTTIAIVDAYDDPNIANDLHQFDVRFGLTDPTFIKINQNGGTSMPSPNGGWIGEIALDVEWAHAIAPGAKILLVEANSASNTDLFQAVRTAASYPNVVAVSMSWAGGESGGQATSDSNTFRTPAGHTGVTFLASSGDQGAPPLYPSTSPNVVSVGGTTLSLNGQGNIVAESAWSGSGGGISSVEAQPSYQNGIVTQTSTRRATPDVAYDSNPSTGFPVYDSYNNGTGAPWVQYGGTSDAAPQWAALIAIADQGRILSNLNPLDGPSETLPRLYQMPASNFHDITTGTTTGSPNYSAGPGYDLTTGRGTPIANLVVPALITGLRLTQVQNQTVSKGGSLNVALSVSYTGNLSITYGGTPYTQAYGLDQQYGFSFGGNDYFNYGGKQDKWFQGSGGTWFFILPNGQLYQWDGTAGQATGTLIATFDTSYYADPSLLYNATPGTSPATVSVSGNVLTITPNAAFVGSFVVQATATDGVVNTTSYFQVTVTGAANLPPVLSPPSDASIVRGASYTVTLNATDGDGNPITYGGSAVSQAYQLDQQYGFFFGGKDYFNYGGQQDKWFQGSGNAWFFILPNGQLYKWDGTAAQATGTLIATMDVSYYANPSLLYNATPGATVSVSGNQLTVTPNVGFVGVLSVTATASDGAATDSKSFSLTVTPPSGTDHPPALDALSNAAISRGSSYTVTLHATDPDGDAILYSATAVSQAYQLKQQYGFFFGGKDYFNYGGQQDKWFQGSGGAWFFILPNGQLYKWDGTAGQATGTLIATMDASYYANPSLLYNATQGATVSVSGTQLTITPNPGFVGTLTVTATASDGTLSDSKSFTLTVS